MRISAYLALMAALTLPAPDASRAQTPAMEILQPPGHGRMVNAAGASITGRCDTGRVKTVRLLSEARFVKYVDVATKEQKENFAREIHAMFPEDFVLGRIIVSGLKAKNIAAEKAASFDRRDMIELKKFWDTVNFREILAFVYDRKILAATVTLSGWRVKEVPLSSPDYRKRFRNTFSFSVPLMPGRSAFLIWGLDAGQTIVQEDSVVFFWTNQYQTGEAPAGISRKPFHAPADEKACSPCHDVSLTEATKNEKPAVEAECKTCHNVLVTRASSHMPAAGWDCLLCHDPSSSPKYQIYSEKSADADMCFECHSDKQEDTTTKPFVHAPAAGGDCRMCHDTHGTPQVSLMVEKVNTVCLSCHEEMGTIPHPVANHPVGGRPMPGDPGRELTCAGCHNPHASDNEHLVFATGMAMCQQCHKK